MKIVDERKPKINFFKEVRISQVFYAVDENEYSNAPYMRIYEIKDENDDYYNAVGLEDGHAVYLNNDEPVILCNATLRIY